MKRKLLLWFSFLLILACSASPNYSSGIYATHEPIVTLKPVTPPTQHINTKDLEKHVFKVSTSDGKVMGTAFSSRIQFNLKYPNSPAIIIDRTVLLTADHVTDTSSKDLYYLEMGSLKFKIDKVFSAYSGDDAAIIVSKEFSDYITLNVHTPPYIDCNTDEITPLTEIISVNNSNYDDINSNIYTKGFISKILNNHIITYLPLTTSGASGSPIFLNEDNKRIIGLITEVKLINKTKENTGVVYVVSGKTICNALTHYYRIAMLNSGVQ